MKSLRGLEPSRVESRWDFERSDLNRRNPEDSGSFRSLEEIVNRVYPQPEEQ